MEPNLHQVMKWKKDKPPFHLDQIYLQGLLHNTHTEI